MHFVRRSFLIHQICHVLHMWQRLKNRTVLHAANVWKPVRQVLSSLVRSFAIKKDVRSHIRVCRFRVISHGVNICGHTTTATSTVSTVMTQEQHHARQPALHISVSRDICSLQKKDVMRMHLHWSRKIIHFRLSVDMYVTAAVRMSAQEVRLMRLLQ